MSSLAVPLVECASLLVVAAASALAMVQLKTPAMATGNLRQAERLLEGRAASASAGDLAATC